MTLADDLRALAREHGMGCDRSGEATRITVRASRHVVEVLAPDAVYEWFITVRDAESGAQVFYDWCDHYDAPPAELDAERLALLTGLLLAVNGARLRVTKPHGWFAVPRLEVDTEAGWIGVWEHAERCSPRGG